ncbi:MAG: STAS domain-containing protein [Fuerstiella sp.]|nr:STAS domain-containing protein [Fuerstiella sp.]MCP4859250.1 STAS domain-containing protein [Fuerstiella sp.]
MNGVTFEEHSGYCTLRFAPELSEMQWKDVEEATKRATQLVHDAPANSVLVDLSTLQTMPSGVVASLVQTWKGMDEKHRRFVVVSPQQVVTDELEQTGLTSLWTLVSTLEHGYSELGVAGDTDGESNQAPPSSVQPAATSSKPYIFEEQRGFCSVQFNPILMTLTWADVESATSQVIQQLEQSRRKSLLVDLGGMAMINSGLIASLVRMWKTMQEKKGQFSLVSPNEVVTDVLKSAGLWKLWSVVDDREEAAYDLGVSRGAQSEQRERRILVMVAVSFATMAAFSMIPMFMKREGDIGVNSQLAALLLAAAALVTGIISVIKDSGFRRILSGFAVIASLAILSSLWFEGNPIKSALLRPDDGATAADSNSDAQQN